MDRMIVVVFDGKANTYVGLKALNQLDADRVVIVYNSAVIH